MTGKNATPLIGWHSADPALKPWVKAEAARRGITERELLDEALSEYRAKHDPPGEGQRAPVSDLLGADPDWCAGQSVDDYVREQPR